MNLCNTMKSKVCCYRGSNRKGDTGYDTDSDDINIDDLEKWLEGTIIPPFEFPKFIKDRTPGTWVEIRLFISSTFVDTHSERDIIIRRIVPSLNRRLADKFIRVIAVDLRWGVTAEESLDCFSIQKTCLNHIDKCRGCPNWTPWFLGLRTSRYGWVQNEYMSSKGFEQPNNFEWLDKMHDFSRGVSITSLECIHAAKIPKALSPKPTVFFYEREIDESRGKQKIPDNLRWIFDFEFVDAVIDDPSLKYQYEFDKSGATGKKRDLNKLNDFLKSQDHITYRNYKSLFSHAKITAKKEGAKSYGVGYTKGLQEFQENVESDLYDAILENYEQVDNAQMDKYEFEMIQHENAINDKESTFVGRKDLVGIASNFFQDMQSDRRTMILHGEPGCGKSGLLAAVAHRAIDKYRAAGHFVFVHMVDCCPGSADLDVFLRRLSAQIRTFRRSLGEINLQREPPTSTSDLKNEHHDFMNESAKKYPKKKFIIILDAVNQFRSSMRAWDMWWLNNHIAPNNLKFLISTLNKENDTFDNSKEMCPDALCLPVLEMNHDDLKGMIRGTLAKFNKKLTENDDALLGNQMELLISKSPSPLYLVAACEALRKFGVFEKVTEYLISLPTTVPDLFEFLLDEWSNEYGSDFVQDVTAMICVSKDGLLENEMQDILSFKERQSGIIYDANFSRIYESLATFLAAGGGGYLRFFHDQLKFAVSRKFLNLGREREIHNLLADFYLSIINTQYDEAPSVKPLAYHNHALNELVYHQAKAHIDGNHMRYLKNSLRNIYFVKERIIAGQQQELDDEYEMMSLLCRNDEESEALSQWRSFSQLYGLRIQEFSQFTLNMAKNQAKNSYVRNDVSSLDIASAGFYPLHWKNTPHDIDPMLVKYEIGGHAISEGGSVVAVTGHKTQLVHISSGEVVQTLNVNGNSTIMSKDGEKVLIGSISGSVCVYDVSTGELEFECSENLGQCVVFVHWTSDYIIAATGSQNGAISWDDHSTPSKVLIARSNDGSTIRTWNTGHPGFDHCFSSKLDMIFTGHNGIVIGWNLEGQEVVRQSANVGDVVYSLTSHETEDLILTGSNDHIIREWKISKDSRNISLVNEIKDPTSSGWAFGGNWAVSYDHTGHRILSTEPISQAIRIYHRNGTLLDELRGHQDCINDISLVNDGNHVVTCDRGNMSILWKLPETNTTSESSGNKEDEKMDDNILWCAFNPDGSKYVTAAEGILRLFDTEGQTLLCTKKNVCNHYSLAGQWMPDGEHFVVINTDLSVAWFDLRLNLVSEIKCFETDDSTCTDLAVSPDGKRVVVSDCRNLRSDLSAATIIDSSDIFNPFKCGVISDYGSRMFSCDINQSGNLFALSGFEGIAVYDLHTLKREYSINSGCFFVKFKSDDKILYESDGNLYLYDIYQQEDITTFIGNGSASNGNTRINQASFLDNENMILSAGSDGVIRLYDTSTGKNVYAFFSHQAQNYRSISVHPNPNKSLVIAADESRMLYILSTEVE